MTTEEQTVAQKLRALLSEISVDLVWDCSEILRDIAENSRIQLPFVVDAIEVFDKKDWDSRHLMVRSDGFSYQLEDAYSIGAKRKEYRDTEAIRVDLSFKDECFLEGYYSVFLYYNEETGVFLGGLIQFFGQTKLDCAVEYHCDIKNTRRVIWAKTRELHHPSFNSEIFTEAQSNDPRINEIIEEQGQILIDNHNQDTGHMWQKTVYLRPADPGSEHRRLYEKGRFLSVKPSTGVSKGAEWFKIIERPDDGKKRYITYSRGGGQEKEMKFSKKNDPLPDMRLKLQRMFNIRVPKDLFPEELKIK